MLSAEIAYCSSANSKVRSTGMSILHACSGAIHRTLDFRVGVCDRPQFKDR